MMLRNFRFRLRRPLYVHTVERWDPVRGWIHITSFYPTSEGLREAASLQQIMEYRHGELTRIRHHVETD